MNPLQDNRVQIGAAALGAVGAALMVIFPKNTKAYHVGAWMAMTFGGILGGGVATR